MNTNFMLVTDSHFFCRTVEGSDSKTAALGSIPIALTPQHAAKRARLPAPPPLFFFFWNVLPAARRRRLASVRPAHAGGTMAGLSGGLLVCGWAGWCAEKTTSVKC